MIFGARRHLGPHLFALRKRFLVRLLDKVRNHTCAGAQTTASPDVLVPG